MMTLPTGAVFLLLAISSAPEVADPPAIPEGLRHWLKGQTWKRDTDGPVIALGASGLVALSIAAYTLRAATPVPRPVPADL